MCVPLKMSRNLDLTEVLSVRENWYFRNFKFFFLGRNLHWNGRGLIGYTISLFQCLRQVN